MTTLSLEKFGYKRQDDRWIRNLSGCLKGIMLTASGLLLVLTLGIGSIAITQARQGITDNSSTGDTVAGYVLLGLMAFGCAGCALFAFRFRDIIDLRRRAFINQGAFKNKVVPFAEVTKLRPVDQTVNGAYMGRHYEIFTTTDPYVMGKQGMKISPSFQDEATANEFQEVIFQLLQDQH